MGKKKAEERTIKTCVNCPFLEFHIIRNWRGELRGVDSDSESRERNGSLAV
jgi:hypothetical protein